MNKGKMKAHELFDALKYRTCNPVIKEFTWYENDSITQYRTTLRIDALEINIKQRTIHGFEIKVNKNDYNRDIKWQKYSSFCTKLSIVCPDGLIKKNEVPDPYGLLYKTAQGWKWEKRPKIIQDPNTDKWLKTYIRVLELEFMCMPFDIQRLENEIKFLKG